MTDIQEFIELEMAKPFKWADTCCCMTADRWIKARSGLSPIQNYGRKYDCESDAKRWMSERGGLLYAILTVMRSSGLSSTESPLEGDVGIIELKDKLCMAIFTGERWFSRDESGFIFAKRDRFVRAWSV